MRRRGLAVVVALMSVASLAACSSSDVPTGAPAGPTSEAPSTTAIATVTVAETVMVSITEFGYDPAEVRIPAGGSVTWTNDGDARHTVTSEGDPFRSSEPIHPGQSFLQPFATPGTYRYHCTFHPDRMAGTVVVVAP